MVFVPVELPSDDAGVENRSGAVLWQHRGAETGRADTPHRPAYGQTHSRGSSEAAQGRFFHFKSAVLE